MKGTVEPRIGPPNGKAARLMVPKGNRLVGSMRNGGVIIGRRRGMC